VFRGGPWFVDVLDVGTVSKVTVWRDINWHQHIGVNMDHRCLKGQYRWQSWAIARVSLTLIK